MQVITVTDREYGENCYIVLANGAISLIDPGIDFESVTRAVTAAALPLKRIFLTHGHYDHTLSLDKFPGIPVYAHLSEKQLLEDAAINLSSYAASPMTFKDITYYSGSTHTIDGFEFIHTPGHTAGCVIIRIENNLFSGDTLFFDTVGRTDLPTGDSIALKNSLKVFDSLGKNLLVYPGHGDPFLLGDAYRTNFFLKR